MLIIIAFVICIWIVRLANTDQKGKFGYILIFGLFIKVTLLIGTCTDIIPLISAHTDADVFDDMARANQGRPFGNWEFTTNYTIFLTILYSITDCTRWFAQFLNLVMSMISLIYLRRILFLLDLTMRNRKIVLTVVTFLPFLNNYAVVLIRESWEFMFVVISLYHFVCWYLHIGNSTRKIVLCVVCLLMAALMHAGVIGIMVGYFMAFLSYDYRANKMRINRGTWVGLILGGLLLIVLLFAGEIFLTKLLGGGNLDYINYRSTNDKADSAYLTWLDYSSYEMVLLFSPLKMFYFMYSPIIFDWRGINDICAFLFDSSVYIVASWYVFAKRVENFRYRLLKKYLLISFFTTTFLFAFGTNSSGDAIRHREKALCILLITAAISTSSRNAKLYRKKY